MMVPTRSSTLNPIMPCKELRAWLDAGYPASVGSAARLLQGVGFTGSGLKVSRFRVLGAYVQGLKFFFGCQWCRVIHSEEPRFRRAVCGFPQLNRRPPTNQTPNL